MQFDFLFPGKTKETYLETGLSDFAKRLSHYARTEIRIIKEQKKKVPTTVGQAGGHPLLSHVRRPTYLVMLDSSGCQFSSAELADIIGNWEHEGRRHITFLVGGPTGFTADVLGQADMLLSLSRLTFTHDMARLLLLEQLYRAFTIRAGTGYHK